MPSSNVTPLFPPLQPAGVRSDGALRLHAWQRYLLVALATAAVAVNGYLLWMLATGRISHLIGCGAGSGCSEILGGRWSTVFYIPVSGLGLVTWVAMLVGLLVVKDLRLARRILLTCGSLLVLAAGWFGFLALLVERQFCGYCATLHTFGLLAGAILWRATRLSRARADARRLWQGPAWFAAAAMAMIISGQLFGPRPKTYQITEFPVEPSAGQSVIGAAVPQEDTPPGRTVPAGDSSSGSVGSSSGGVDQSPGPKRGPKSMEPSQDTPLVGASVGGPQSRTPVDQVTAAGRVADPPAAGIAADRVVTPARTVTFLEGKIRYPLGQVPFLGDPQASRVVVKYFDYTCHSCRQMHRLLQRLVQENPRKVAVIVIPMPLNRRCNSGLPIGVPDHPYACELAELALAVWRADPAAFARFHDQLFAAQGHLTPQTARQMAERLVPADRLAEAERDPWIAKMLAHSNKVYASLSRRSPRMPKVLLGDRRVMHGLPSSYVDLYGAVIQAPRTAR